MPISLIKPAISSTNWGADVNANWTSIENAINALVPIGAVFDYAGPASVPAGFLLCDGSAVSRTTYAALFTVLGTTWGVGDGSSTFNLPDLRRRVTVGTGGAGTGILGNTVGSIGGAETVILSGSHLPPHTHSAWDGSQFATASGIANMNFAAGNRGPVTGTSGSTGIGSPHDNMQPSAVMNKIIKA